MESIKMRHACLACLSLMLFGCASIMHGPTQEVGISSSPSGASVTINNEPQGATPCVVELKRKTKQHNVNIEMEGYQTHKAIIRRTTGRLWLWNFFFIYGIPIDFISGAAYNLTPEQISATLMYASPEAAPRTRISGYRPPDIILSPYTGKKYYTAVLDLEARQGISQDSAKMLSELLSNGLVNTGRFKMVDRMNIGVILQEQGLQMSGCTDQSCAVEFGRILGVERIVTGSVGKMGDTYVVSAVLVNVETAEIVGSAMQECYNCDESDLIAVMGVIAKMLANAIK